MRFIVILFGIAMLGIGGYCTYTLVNVLFVKGLISNSPTFFIILCLMGLLIGIILLYYGFKLLKMAKNKQ